jgi:hypothetical protein
MKQLDDKRKALLKKKKSINGGDEWFIDWLIIALNI